ncbi:hypothetical protein FIBSPDRAFT_968791 [Athelia psychrophila]|uniref:Uncharacterized protein n=1 Tax=Athelia psychrophila TaxID=1759441 RepID=A0A167U7S9_9AGAM|nr:hypothetical protein FIBSPDRAFT_968791 [Fibularhizoctonia sp. CBS 109695]
MSPAQACTQPRSPPAPTQPPSALPAPVSSPHLIPTAQPAPSSHRTTRTRPAKSVHALDRATKTLFEEGPAAAAAAVKKAKGGRSNTIPGLELLSPEHKPPSRM